MKILNARITAMPKGMFDLMPVVYATTADGVEHELFSFYPDEISFTATEFEGLTVEQARSLRYKKDVAYLKS